MGNEQPMRKISHSEMAQAIENVDQRIITAIKVERWIAAICEFKNLFYCTVEELRELRMANAGNFAELTMEEKAMQQAMHDKLDIVEYILNNIPKVIDHRVKPQPVVLKPH